MQLGMIGLGRMGGNIVRRLTRNGHQCVVFDRDPAAVTALIGKHVAGSADLKELVGKLDKPRAVWVMLPAGEITEATVGELGEFVYSLSRELEGASKNRTRAVVGFTTRHRVQGVGELGQHRGVGVAVELLHHREDGDLALAQISQSGEFAERVVEFRGARDRRRFEFADLKLQEVEFALARADVTTQ